MRILVLVAGTNEPSNSNMLSDVFIQGMQQVPGTDIDKLRLRDLTIEHFTLDFYAPQCNQEEDFCRVQKLMEQCSGFVIASPIWNFSVPAHLKNLIDRMGSFALDETRSKGTLGGKPFYIIFTGGAPMPAWAGLMQMTTSHVREAFRYFGATPVETYFEPKCTKGRGQFGLVVDERPETLSAIREKGKAFAETVKIFAETGKLPVEKKGFSLVYKLGNAVLKRL